MNIWDYLICADKMALSKFAATLLGITLLLPLAVFAANPVDINTASVKELDALTGIGPTIAQRIIDGRPYYSLDGLLQVKGIGRATLQKIKDQGLAYVTPEMASQAPKQQPTPTTALSKSEKSGNTVTISTQNAALTQPAGQGPNNHAAVLFFTIAGLLVISGLAYAVWMLSKPQNHVRP